MACFARPGGRFAPLSRWTAESGKEFKQKTETLAPEAAKRARRRDGANISWNFSMVHKEKILSNDQGV